MRHVTDGELHAFLDGALDLLPEGRGEEIRDHISECSVCRERLQDEDLIRSQAADLLAEPDLSAVSYPTFEELRERAEAPASGPSALLDEEDARVRYRGPLRGLPLAWAATIVLALGVGWMGAQMSSTPPSRTLEGGLMDVSAEDLSEAEEPGEVEADLSQIDELRASRPDIKAVSAPVPVEVEAAEGPPQDARPERARESQQGETILAEERTPSDTGAVREEARVAEPEVSFEGLVVTADSLAGAARFAGAREAKEDPLALPTVPDSLEKSLVVPGLKVVSIEWEERVEGEKALFIRQLLSPGDTLELRYLGMLLGTEPEPDLELARSIPREEGAGGRVYANVLEASLPPGWNQVVMEWGRGYLVARAPVSEANLKALLKSLH
jgi:hypothetical protein